MQLHSSHERATLRLRQTVSDVQCAVQHLDMASFAVISTIEGMPAAIEAIKQQLSDVLVQLEQCQRKVYSNWHASMPPLT
jgi:hypothetical protein